MAGSHPDDMRLRIDRVGRWQLCVVQLETQMPEPWEIETEQEQERERRMLDYYRRTAARQVEIAIDLIEFTRDMRIAADEQDAAWERYERELREHGLPDNEE